MDGTAYYKDLDLVSIAFHLKGGAIITDMKRDQSLDPLLNR